VTDPRDKPRNDPRDDIVTHLAPLRAFAISLTRDTQAADDLVQDTIVKAWGNFEKFQPGTNLQAWMFTILRNTFYSGKRKLSREVADVDGVFAANLSVSPDHDGRLAVTDFLKFYGQLPVEQREVLALVGASGFSYEEAAQMCDVKIGTIKSRINRARQRLAELMALD